MTDPYNYAGPGPYGALPEIPAEPEAVELEPSKPSAKDIYDSLNYFDELAVKNTFGEELLALKQRKNAFMRALIFSDLRKNHGLKDKAAQERVFLMVNAEVQEWFRIDEDAEDQEPDEDPTEPLS